MGMLLKSDRQAVPKGTNVIVSLPFGSIPLPVTALHPTMAWEKRYFMMKYLNIIPSHQEPKGALTSERFLPSVYINELISCRSIHQAAYRLIVVE
jgi:hypothetical protein